MQLVVRPDLGEMGTPAGREIPALGGFLAADADTLVALLSRREDIFLEE